MKLFSEDKSNFLALVLSQNGAELEVLPSSPLSIHLDQKLFHGSSPNGRVSRALNIPKRRAWCEITSNRIQFFFPDEAMIGIFTLKQRLSVPFNSVKF